MRYLLVGNGECKNAADLAADADVIIQINSCRHNAVLPKRTRYVFLINSGGQMSSVIEKMPLSELGSATVILARNPTVYSIKQRLLKLKQIPDFETFEICGRPTLPMPVKMIGFLEGLRLEYKMRVLGMPFRLHPSSGMVAYYWLCNRLKEGDELSLAGFSFEGWHGHPWAIERRIIKPIP